MESFPPTMQILVTVLGGILAVGVHLWGQLKKSPDKGKDVMVPSVNILDGATFRDAAHMLREATAANEARDRAMRRFMQELEEANELGRRQVELLENIDRRIAAEHYRLRERAQA